MNEIKQQIQTILAQDVMLEPQFKSMVLSKLEQLSQKKLSKILATLQKLVAQEEAIIARTLEKKPFLFHEIQHKILQIMHQEFVKKENETRAQAEVELKNNLETYQS